MVLNLARPAEIVAPLLVGAVLRDGGVTVVITEVEAYAGSDDPAAHAWPGPRPHTVDLFGGVGTLYVYRSYDIHYCGNVVCDRDGSGSAILLRSGRVVDGWDLARQRHPGVTDVALARGPGNLGRVMGWTLADSGRRFGTHDGPQLSSGAQRFGIRSGPRVGVSVAHQRPWRFWAEAEDTVSAYRRSPRIAPDAVAW